MQTCTHVGMHVGMRAEMCADMGADTCVVHGVYTDMCIDPRVLMGIGSCEEVKGRASIFAHTSIPRSTQMSTLRTRLCTCT